MLTQGMIAIVDDEDFERFGKFKWYALKDKKTYYAVRNVGLYPNRIKQRLHREILNTPKGIDIDHINGNGLDDKRENLRLCTRQENCRNQRHARPGKNSKFKGVHWSRQARKWHAQIKMDGHTTYLGYFSDDTDAAQAYDAAARKLFGEFAAPNFN